MNLQEEHIVNQLLDEDFDSYDSNISMIDDSDADPNFYPSGVAENGGSTRSSPDESNYDLLSSNALVPQRQNLDLSDDEYSTEVSGSSSSCDESEKNDDDSDWVDDYKTIFDFKFNSNSSGIKINILESAKDSPIEIFNQIWTDDILAIIISSTNNFGKNLTSKNRPHNKNSRSSTFKNTEKEEINKFLGLCLLFGSAKFSVLRDAFSNNPLYYYPIAKQIMSGRRFEQLLNSFSVEYADQNIVSADGPMKKLEPVYTMLINNFQNAFYPHIELSLDESLLLHRGRLGFRQYIKGKKAKYGIKFYELCSPDGYVLNIEMYKGKQFSSAALTSKIDNLVQRLMAPYLNKGHHLFMDNYYNSVNLSNLLLKHKTHTTGTLRSNRRGNPKYVIQKKLKKGDHIWKRQKSVYISKWKDKRDVLCITTNYQPKMIVSKNKYGQEKPKPIEIARYNDYMSGVDRADQMISYYSCPRKSAKWYKKVIFHLLDVAVWNSFFLYKQHFGCPEFRFKIYRDLLIKDLIKIPKNKTATELFQLKKYSKKSSQREDHLRDDHYEEPIPLPPNFKRPKKFKNCVQCYKQKTRKQTSIQCQKCKVPLCPLCFKDYHAA